MTENVMQQKSPLDQLLDNVNAEFDAEKEYRRKQRNKRKARLRKQRKNK